MMPTESAKMEAAVLAGLEPAKRAHFEGKLWYRGGGGELADIRRKPGPLSVITYHGRDRTLAAHVYDLRATLAWLSRTTPGAGRACVAPLQDWDVSRHFAVAFSRAVRSLIARGDLVQLVPDGVRSGREIRFVARPGD